MKTLQMIVRIIFGLFLLFFGLNHLFTFMTPPPPPEAAAPYWEMLGATKTMSLVGIVEALAGLFLLLNRYVALSMLVLLGVSVNAVLYHIYLDSAGLPMGIVLLALNILMIAWNWSKYKDLLS